MRKAAIIVMLSVMFSSCYKKISLDGFEKDKWDKYQLNCSTYRLAIAEHLIDNQHVLLEGTQNEIESLLGQAAEHELYERNQKFFHYRLTPPDSCNHYEAISYLSIRFNAMGRANLVQVMLREVNN